MIKPKGTTLISIGSAGLAIIGGLGILISPFVIALASWAGALLRGLDLVLENLAEGASYPLGTVAGRIISVAGISAGALMLLFSALQLTCGILVWKRREDTAKAGFALAMGIAFAIISLSLGLTALGLVQLALSVLLIVGAALNHEQVPKEDAAG